MAKQGFSTSDRRKVQVLSAATAIKKHDCGTVFVINNAGATAHTIPAAATLGDGWWCRIVNQASTGDNTVTLGTGTVNLVEAGADGTTHGITNAGQVITIVKITAGAGTVGDEVEIVVANGEFFVRQLMAT